MVRRIVPFLTSLLLILSAGSSPAQQQPKKSTTSGKSRSASKVVKAQSSPSAPAASGYTFTPIPLPASFKDSMIYHDLMLSDNGYVTYSLEGVIYRWKGQGTALETIAQAGDKFDGGTITKLGAIQMNARGQVCYMATILHPEGRYSNVMFIDKKPAMNTEAHLAGTLTDSGTVYVVVDELNQDSKTYYYKFTTDGEHWSSFGTPVPAELLNHRQYLQMVATKTAYEIHRSSPTTFRPSSTVVYSVPRPAKFPDPSDWKKGDPINGYIVGSEDYGTQKTAYFNAECKPVLIYITEGKQAGFWTPLGLLTKEGGSVDLTTLNRQGQIVITQDSKPILATPTNMKPENTLPQPGDLVVYQNEKKEYNHVAIVMEVKPGTAIVTKVRSKWGSWGLYDHDPNQTRDYGIHWTVLRRRQRKLFQPEKPEYSTALPWFPEDKNWVVKSDFFETDKGRAIYPGQLPDPSPASSQAMDLIRKAHLDTVREIEPPTQAYDCRGFVFGNKREPIAGYWWYFRTWNQVQEILEDDYDKIPAKDSAGQDH